MVRALSIKSKRKRIAGNILRSQQNTSHYMQNSILSCFRAIACLRISSRQLLVKPCLRISSRQLLVKPDLGKGCRGNFNPLPCWFSFNNLEKLNAVTLAFCSIQLHFLETFLPNMVILTGPALQIFGKTQAGIFPFSIFLVNSL